jgi:PAS domain S-box-containing protein
MTAMRNTLLLLCLLAMPWAQAASGPAAWVPDAAQKEWLAQHPRLRVGVLLQAPYAQYDRRLQQLSGYHIDLLKRVAGLLGVDVQWLTFSDPDALQAAALAGSLDLAPGLLQTPVGLRTWLYSDPYLRVAQLVVGARDTPSTVDLEQLDGRTRLAVRQPSPVADYLQGSYPNLDLQGVASDRQALQAVVNQQARYAIVDEAQLGRLGQEGEFNDLAIVGDSGFAQLPRLASRRDWPLLATLLQSALQAIPNSELEQWRGRWLQPHYARLSESPGFWQNLLLLFAVLLLAGGAIVAWQRRHLQQTEQALQAARVALAERQSAEDALRLTQFSIEQSTVGILWVKWDGHVRYANLAAERILGYPRHSLVERPLTDFDPSLHLDRWMTLWNNARASEQVAQSHESHCLRADGSRLPVDLTLSFLRAQQAEYLVVYLSDISERRRTVAALQQSEAQLRELSAHLESVREEEKARIAREVHDELGQVLTVLKLETSMCELAYGGLDPGLQARLDSMKRLIAQQFQLVRDVATALRPPILDAGIGSAIEWQARRFEARTQIPCLVRVPDELPALSDAKAIGLFRILQEALTNVMRHAQAHTVHISLARYGERLCLTVSDDGVGFRLDQVLSASFGLVGMRERVLMLGGSLELDSEPGAGTSLSVQVPLDHVSSRGVPS